MALSSGACGRFDRRAG